VTLNQGLFLHRKLFLKITKKLRKVYNCHEYLLYKSCVIWSQNIEVMAKKYISMQSVTQNRTCVSCNHPKKVTNRAQTLILDIIQYSKNDCKLPIEIGIGN